MSEHYTPSGNGEGPGARERSEPSCTTTMQPNCAPVRSGNQVVFSTTGATMRIERAHLGRIVEPRQRRAIMALLARPLARKQLDDIAGCINSPDLVMKLREFGLEIPCVRQPVTDRDGKRAWYGIYSLTAEDKSLVRAALRNGGHS